MKHSIRINFTAVVIMAALSGCSVLLPHWSTHLPENIRHLSPRIISSGEPSGRGAFLALRNEGIQTIISVDGSAPDVKTANREGLRYVHLPIGYDGVPTATVTALDEVLKSTTGKILVHCHHGKHRGPAAAVIACMIEGSMTHEQALAALKEAGTSPDYAGLWRDVRGFAGVPKGATSQPIVESALIDPFANSMVQIDNAFERLADLLGSIDKRPRAAREQAILLAEGFRELKRHAHGNSEALKHRLANAEQLSRTLVTAIESADMNRARQLYETVKADCRTCHAKFRN
jgi:protein tyrosine phosphatase (PTP) superfamily phosphohydrolase (DUF442 family)